MLGLRTFLDDSGSDDLSPIATIGGTVMSRISCRVFGRDWSKLLPKYRVSQPLHMTDFVRPYGQHVGMYPEIKLALFRDVVKLINRLKLYSLSVAIPQADFRSLLSSEVCKTLIGPYALAFFCVVFMNRGVWQTKNIQHKTGYLVDDGSAYKDQLVAAHSVVMKIERDRGEFPYTAALAFDVDDRVPALQAADLIAWSARRRELTGPLTDEFEPLNDLFSGKPPHGHVSIPKDGIQLLATPINNWISRNGSLPSLVDIVR